MSIFQDETPGFTDPDEIDDGRTLEPIEFAGHETGGAPCEGNAGWLASDRESPSTFEPDMEQARRVSGSFAESQQRLARALDSLTELAIRREE